MAGGGPIVAAACLDATPGARAGSIASRSAANRRQIGDRGPRTSSMLPNPARPRFPPPGALRTGRYAPRVGGVKDASSHSRREAAREEARGDHLGDADAIVARDLAHLRRVGVEPMQLGQLEHDLVA